MSPSRDLTLPGQILLLINPSSHFSQVLSEGIHAYLQEHTDWTTKTLPYESLERYLQDYHRGHFAVTIKGIIAHVVEKSMGPNLEKSHLPWINVSRRLKDRQGTEVLSDDYAIGQMAAEYFLERHFNSFAYIGIEEHGYSEMREKGFTQTLAESGKTVTRLEYPIKQHNDRSLIEEWGQRIRQQPFPLALFCTNDFIGQQFMRLSPLMNLRIPDDVSVLGTDADQRFNSYQGLTLASILPGFRGMGLVSARLLHQANGQSSQLPGREIVIPPEKLVKGSSADHFAVANPFLAKAMNFIARSMDQPIEVDEVARHAGISRRKLERLFQTKLGISPYNQILRFRINQAKTLLTQTDDTIEKISEQCGFSSFRIFYQNFRKLEKGSPSAFRKKFRQAEEILDKAIR